MTVRVDVHLAPDRPQRRARGRRAPWAHRDTEGPAAEVVLRRPRLAAVRRDHPARRVLPDPRRAGDPRSRARTRSRRRAARTRSSSSAPGRRRRRASCSTRSRAPGTLRRFVPFDVSETTLRDAAARDRRGAPGHRRARGRRRLRAPPRPSCPGADAAWSRSSVARSATCRRRRAPSSSPRSRPGLEPGDSFLLGTDLVKDVDRLVAAYDDAAGVTAAFNRNVLLGDQPRAGRRLRPRRLRPRRPLERRRRSGSRCGSAPTRPRRSRSPSSTSSSSSPPGEEMRTEISAKFRREGITAELAAAGLALTALVDRRRRRLRPQPRRLSR